jgi:hypothetical protein
MEMDVPLNQFIPDFLFRNLDPLALNFHNTAPCTAHPRNIFWDFDKFNTLPHAWFAHALAVKRRVCSTDQAEFTSKTTCH